MSEFTLHKPKELNKKYKFYVSGIADKPIKRLSVAIDCHNDDWSEYYWLGGSGSDISDIKNGQFDVEAGYFKHTFEVTIYDLPPVSAASDLIYQVALNSGLWQTLDGVIEYGDKKDGLPANIENGTVMATIKNFKIRLVGGSGSGGSGGSSNPPSTGG